MKTNRVTGWLVCLLLLAAHGWADAGDVEIRADVVYGHKDGMALFYDVFRPAEANGSAVLFMVSGGWFSRWQPPEQRVRQFSYLLDAGITVFAVHHGSAPRFSVPEALGDVRRAVRHVRLTAAEHGIDPARIGVLGGSAGGHLSLMLGLAADDGDPDAADPVERTPNRVSAVVAYFPPVDLRPLVGSSERFPALDFDPELAPGVSPILFADAADPPTLIVHGDADTLVPVSSGRAIHEALRRVGAPAKLIVIEDGDHGFSDPEHRARAARATRDWFVEHL